MEPSENEPNSDENDLHPIRLGNNGRGRDGDPGKTAAIDIHRTEINAFSLDSKKICILLPTLGRSFSVFAEEMGKGAQKALGDKVTDGKMGAKGIVFLDPSDPNECFLCIRNGLVGRIVQEKDVARQHSGLIFTILTSDQAITELERWIQSGVLKMVLGKKFFFPSSMTRVTSATLLASSQFHQFLPKVERIFDFAIPYGFVRREPPKNSSQAGSPEANSPKETFTAGTGKSKLTGEILRMGLGFNHYKQKNGEVVRYYCNRQLDHFISLEQAKKVIEKLLWEFKFADDTSRAHAIARLLTPYCQGLMGWRKRSPLWIFTADRPRAGKDYLAMLTPLIHSHWAVQDPPLETDDEVKRRITAALASGRRFMHFANCRKDLDHPSLEAAITSEFWSDRIIRSSNEVTVPNEIIFSLSYNEELPITEDLMARCRQIRLQAKEGESNAHKYAVPLHDAVTRHEAPKKEEWIDPYPEPKTEHDKWLHATTKLCRRNILAAFDALVRNWAEKNCPHGSTFTSFPEWSRIVGGIMLAADYPDPCTKDENLVVATADDWKDDLIRLAECVCIRNEKQFFTTGDFIEQFILPKLNDFPMFNALIGKHELQTFSALFGKYIKRYSRKSLRGKKADYVFRPHEFRNPPRYQVIMTAVNVPSSEAQEKQAANNGHLLEYLHSPEN